MQTNSASGPLRPRGPAAVRSESMTAVYTDDPALVSGCPDCMELMTEDPGDDNEYRGHCLHCRREITAQGGVEWRRTVRRPCPYCGKTGR